MKIKSDFVTNSSSTSFLLISKEELSEDTFLSFLGVKENSTFYTMVEDLFYNMKSGLSSIEEVYNSGRYSYSSVEEYLKNEFSDIALKKYLEALEKGYSVFVGHLSSELGALSSFMCMDSLIEESETYYLHYTNCYW